jgi:hypothetical protein
MTNTAPVAARTTGTTAPRHLPFRLVCAALAGVFLVAFGIWRAWLTPWVTLADDVDHGWTRTPELHRWADTAAAGFYLVLSAGLLLLVLSPRNRSGVSAWITASLVMMTGLSVVGSLLQQHQGLVGAVLMGLALMAVFVGPLLAAAPDRTAVLRGGRPAVPPAGGPRLLLLAGTIGWAAVAVAGLAWRLGGGMVESPREDDVLSFLNLGASVALACGIALRGRAGWRVLAWLAAGVTAYALVALPFLALG